MIAVSICQISVLAQESVTGTFDPVLDSEFVTDPVGATYVIVRTAQELERALLNVQPGQVIEIADGEYDLGRPFYIRNKRATAEKPIIVRAQNRGQAIIAGNSSFWLDSSSYIVIDGLQFRTAQMSSNGLRIQNSDHSRVTRSHFALVEPIGNKDDPSRHWLLINGFESTANRIDHNLFERKRTVGNFITIAGDDTRVAQHNRIDHNHFLDIMYIGSGGNEAIRIGNSYTSTSDAYTIIERNLFERCNGEGEIISIKSGSNAIRYNTFLESEGAVTFRHGNNTSVYGNYFIGNGKPNTGGVRVYGADHKVYNNYFIGLAGTGVRAALSLGMADVENQVTVMDYWQVERLLVANNTFINNKANVGVVSTGSYSLAPKGVLMINNLFVTNTTDPVVNLQNSPQITWVNNMVQLGSGGTLGIAADTTEIRPTDLQLSQNTNGYYIDANSPAIDAAVLLPEVTVDIEGKLRGGKPDVGAFEYAGYPLLQGPLTAADVGPEAISTLPVDLSTPGLYFTTLELAGDFDPKAGWWGPIQIEAVAHTTGQLNAPITISMIIDGKPVYSSTGASSQHVVNQGELADGWHRLIVVAESGSVRSQRSIDFQVGNMRMALPIQSAKHSERIPVQLAVGIPTVLVDSVRLTVADQVVYEGKMESLPAWVDAMAYSEGLARFTATAWSNSSSEMSATVNIMIDNYWELEDGLYAPQASWFGVLDRSLTLATSDGWDYDTSNAARFFGDTDRKVRLTKNQEWLVWETPRLQKASITIYSQDEDLTNQVVLAVSADQKQWVETPYQLERLERSADGWYKLNLLVEIADPNAVKYFRFTVEAGQHGAGELQLGNVYLIGLNSY
jgi:hypothetical protein